MSQLPSGTLGTAVGVLIYTFICLITNVLLIWLHWISRQRLSYVALIGYFALMCVISSIIQQIYNYTLWNDLMWAQLHYIQANYQNADVAFNNGNFGFMRVLANIRLFCYIMESSYLLSYSIQITVSVYDIWSTRRRAKKACAIACKIVPLVLAGISIALLQTPVVQKSFLVYMVVANVQSVTSCAISIILLMLILWKFINTKRGFRYLDTSSQSNKGRWFRAGSKSGSGTDSSGIPDHRPPPKVFDNSWLVFRLSIAIVLISLFIFASLATHIPQRDDVARDAQADEPDLGPGRAKSNIVGYIFGVTPGLAIWIVFGLTKEFRQIMLDKCVPRRWRKREPETEPTPLLQSPWGAPAATPSNQHMSRLTLAPIATDIELQLDDLDRTMKRRATPEPDAMIAPLLTANQVGGPARSFRSTGAEREDSRSRRLDG